MDVDLYGHSVPGPVRNLALLDAVEHKQFHVVRRLLQGRNRADPLAYEGALFRVAWDSGCEPIWSLLFQAVVDTPEVVERTRAMRDLTKLCLGWYMINNRPEGMSLILRFPGVVNHHTINDLAECVPGPAHRIMHDGRAKVLFPAVSDTDLMAFLTSDRLTTRARQCVLAWYVSKDVWFCADCGRAFLVEDGATVSERETMAMHCCLCESCDELRYKATH